jgi:hypothetical protein
VKKRIGTFLALFVLICFVTSCTTLKGNVPFGYQPSLIAVSKKINKNVGFDVLKDMRPENEIRATEKSIQDLTNKVTYKLIEDFRSSGIFDEINFPAKDTDDLIINGEINKFIWREDNNWFAIIFMPLVYFGLPVGDYVGEADITLKVIDKKTGQVLGTVRGAGEQRLTVTLYSMSVGEIGSELAEAFRQCVKQLKEKILTEISL